MLNFTMTRTMAMLTILHFAAHKLPRLIDGGNVLRLLSSLCWLQFPSHRVSSAHRVNSTVNTIGRRVVLMLANGLMQDHGTLIQRLWLFFSVVCFGQQCLCYKTT